MNSSQTEKSSSSPLAKVKQFTFSVYSKTAEAVFSVPRTGLEPACLTALPPQGSKSTNFSTWALKLFPHYTECIPDYQANIHRVRRRLYEGHPSTLILSKCATPLCFYSAEDVSGDVSSVPTVSKSFVDPPPIRVCFILRRTSRTAFSRT